MRSKKEFFLERDQTRWGYIDTAMVLLVLIGLALNAWGIVMNGVVVIVNNDVMPVITDKPIIILTDYGTPRKFVPDGKLLMLADRIIFDFPVWNGYVPDGISGKIIHWWGKYLDYPLEGGLNIVSIGDICRWIGSILFLLVTPIIILSSIRRIFSGELPRICK